MEGCGNHFVVAYRSDLPDATAAIAGPLCDPHFGVGADGVLLIEETDAFGMRVWNADGSEAEMCGNGLRCVVRRLIEDGRWPGGRQPLNTGAGRRWGEPRGTRIRVGIGEPRLGPTRELRVDGRTIVGREASLGNPHFVVVQPDLPDLRTWGPTVERDPTFPQRTNVEHVIVEAPDRLRVRVWERGVGETLACGSGAVASAAVVVGPRSGDVVVALPGGELGVSWAGPGQEAELEGPARTVFTARWAGLEA